MREIKFRGKRLDNNQWAYGCLIIRNCDGYKSCYIYDDSFDETEIDDYADDLGKGISLKDLFIRVDPKTVGQYTNLSDKNGKEIYERDIINYLGGIGEIVWHKQGYWSVKWNKKNTAYNNRMAVFCGEILGSEKDIFSSFEVIGNKFENPELLEAK